MLSSLSGCDVLFCELALRIARVSCCNGQTQQEAVICCWRGKFTSHFFASSVVTPAARKKAVMKAKNAAMKVGMEVAAPASPKVMEKGNRGHGDQPKICKGKHK